MDALEKLMKIADQFNGSVKLITQENSLAYQIYEEALVGAYQKQLTFEPEESARYLFKTMKTDDKQSYVIVGVTAPYSLNQDRGTYGKGIIDYSAWEADYHEVLQAKIQAMRDLIEEDPLWVYQESSIDTSPYIERELGFLLELGEYGVNQMLIHPQWGTCFNMGFVIYRFNHESDLEGTDNLRDNPFYHELVRTRIGESKRYSACESCNRCAKACPAQILGKDKTTINRTACISYLTQSKAFINESEAQRMNWQLYGCSICQSVCPANAKLDRYNLLLKESHNQIELDTLLKMTNKTFKTTYAHKGFTWRGLRVMKRNALIVLANHPDTELIEWVLNQKMFQEDDFYQPYYRRLEQIVNNPS